MRPATLVEAEELARDAQEALAQVVRVADDFDGRVGRRRPRALHHELAAGGEQLIERREVGIDGGHGDVSLVGDVAPRGAEDPSFPMQLRGRLDDPPARLFARDRALAHVVSARHQFIR